MPQEIWSCPSNGRNLSVPLWNASVGRDRREKAHVERACVLVIHVRMAPILHTVVPVQGNEQPSPILDSSWSRVEAFDPNRPALASGSGSGSAFTFSGQPAQADQDGDVTMAAGDAPQAGISNEREGEDDEGEWEYEDEEVLVTFDLGPEAKRLIANSKEYSVTVSSDNLSPASACLLLADALPSCFRCPRTASLFSPPVTAGP